LICFLLLLGILFLMTIPFSIIVAIVLDLLFDFDLLPFLFNP
jgi:hypothetical protein